jgi:uncharacterized membrane protein
MEPLPPVFPVAVADSFSSSGRWRWLRRHPVFPLLLACAGSSLLSVLLVAARKLITGHGRLGFIPFNLVLAFMPLAFLLLFERSLKRSHAVACSGMWLLFFPNAPYMLTDLVHFDKHLGPASWLDLMALIAAAWAALLGGMISLRFMQERVRRHHSSLAGHGFVVAVLFLSSIGIYIGRFLRFHSWHALQKPGELLRETAAQFFPPAMDPMAWPFTLAVFGLLCCIHYSLLAFAHAARRE